jgi:thioredoxin-related protein
MKNISIFAMSVMILMSTSFSIAREIQNRKLDIYDPHANVKALIDSGLKSAALQNKHLLLMFGANWCPWCHRLHALFQSDSLIKALLEKSYILIIIDIGEKHDEPLNRELEKKYRVEGFGYPALAVIDKEGALLCAQSTGVLEKSKGHDPKKVLSFLIAQASGDEKSLFSSPERCSFFQKCITCFNTIL